MKPDKHFPHRNHTNTHLTMPSAPKLFYAVAATWLLLMLAPLPASPQGVMPAALNPEGCHVNSIQSGDDYSYETVYDPVDPDWYTDYLVCTGVPTGTIAYNAAHADVQYLRVSGNFRRMRIDPRYRHLQRLYLESENMKTLAFRDYARFSALTEITAVSNNVERVNLGGVGGLGNLTEITLDWNTISNISGSFVPMTSLRDLHLNGNKLRRFDFSILPGSVEVIERLVCETHCKSN